MKKSEVLKLLKDNTNQRGVEHWKKRQIKGSKLKSFGIGLTQLRKLSKQVGRDHDLALQLWNTNVYDAKVVGLLIDDPKQVTRAQAEEQVEALQGGYLAHVFSSCDATLAKTPFAFDLACDWMESEDPIRRRCAYSLIYELSKKNPKGMDDDFLLALIGRIQKDIKGEDMWVREAMNSALMGIGKRNKKLNRAALRAAKAIGPVDVEYGDDNACEPLDVVKHLTSEHLVKKLKL
jgi:3-methyladenine DNA glycosylase AlkD